MNNDLGFLESMDDAPIVYGAPLSSMTGFRTGGMANTVYPQNEKAFIDTIAALREHSMSFFVLGNGSNVLALDEGYGGVVVKTEKALFGIEFNDEICRVQAGVPLAKLCLECMERALSGLEFAYGIPGSLGGAVYMNAGAYDGEMKDVVKSVRVLTGENTVRELSAEEMAFTYRRSAAQSEEYIILSADLQLHSAEKEAVRAKMNELLSRRREKQPLELPSCGSTFKRPSGSYASKLIDECGLRGMSVGGAQVSEKHCGFIVNKGGASSGDILELIKRVQNVVKDKTGFMLECEVRILK